MSIIKYNKLVRDRIPEIIEVSGKNCKTKILNDEEYLRMIDAKLDEELAEYQESKSLEELADLLEVMEAVVNARGYTWEQLMAEKDPARLQLLETVDVLVDGPFLLGERSLELQYCGSRNQRLIDVRKTRQAGEVVRWEAKRW